MITIRNVSHTIGSNPILNDVSLDIPEGGITALIGPNAGFVRAGALASTFSDQNAWLAVIDRLLDQPPAAWPRTLYPERFRVAGNQQVARALGIEAIDPVAAQQAVAAGEKHR